MMGRYFNDFSQQLQKERFVIDMFKPIATDDTYKKFFTCENAVLDQLSVELTICHAVLLIIKFTHQLLAILHSTADLLDDGERNNIVWMVLTTVENA